MGPQSKLQRTCHPWPRWAHNRFYRGFTSTGSTWMSVHRNAELPLSGVPSSVLACLNTNPAAHSERVVCKGIRAKGMIAHACVYWIASAAVRWRTQSGDRRSGTACLLGQDSGAPSATRAPRMKSCPFQSGQKHSICNIGSAGGGVWVIGRAGGPGSSEVPNSRHEYRRQYTADSRVFRQARTLVQGLQESVGVVKIDGVSASKD